MLFDTITLQICGPLAGFAQGYSKELERLGYAPASVRLQMKVLAELSEWLSKCSMDVRHLVDCDLGLFLHERRAAGHTRYVSLKALRPVLDYLQRLEVIVETSRNPTVGPIDDILHRFGRYLTIERALVPSTTRTYMDMIRPFLEGRLAMGGLVLNLDRMTAADIVSFIVAHCPRQGRGAAKLTVTAIRSFLGFLHREGVIAEPLISSVPSIAGRRLASLPKGLEPDQIRRLLTSCDGATRQGVRDFAILTMLVRLGLRSGEVAKLRLDDIDWRAGDIVVRGKASSIERIPLPTDVGRAVADYLHRGRPASAQDRTVFIRIKAPHRSLSSSGVSMVVADAARRAGLGTVHAHRLRHTAATQMLRAGASLPEIGQLLRHRRALTTAIYAKVNRDALRTIARPWPGDAA
jgi:site-specific recombinase XerD